MMMSLETLELLRKCLCAQVLNVGDPGFPDAARRVTNALIEVDAEIANNDWRIVGEMTDITQGGE